MGRGRQKAKHMKVARKLKYYSPEPDLNALQRELSGTEEDDIEPDEVDSDEDDDYSYADFSLEDEYRHHSRG